MTDGCVHLLYNNSWKFHQLAAMQLLSGQPVRYGKGRWYCPSITYKNHTCRVTLLQPARRAVVLGQSSSLRPHWLSELSRLSVFLAACFQGLLLKGDNPAGFLILNCTKRAVIMLGKSKSVLCYRSAISRNQTYYHPPSLSSVYSA